VGVVAQGHHQNGYGSGSGLVFGYGFVLFCGFGLLGGRGLCGMNVGSFAAVSSRSMMKFEGGFSVETVFDGSKLGIEPYAVEVLPNGELLILDSANSNIYRISSSLSLCKCHSVGLMMTFCYK